MPGHMTLTRAAVFVGQLAVTCVLLSCRDDADVGSRSAQSIWHLTEDLRLGAVEGGSPESFGGAVVVEATEDGIVIVGDPQSAEIRYFGADGRHLRTVGNRGMGPGEYQDIIGLALDAEARLWVADRGAARVTVLDSDGSLLQTHPYAGFVNFGWGGRVDSNGQLHNPILVNVPTGFQPAYERWGEAGFDTLVIPKYAPAQREISASDGRTRLVNVPFAARPHWAIDTDGLLWYGTSDKYVLFRIAYNGDTVLTIDRTGADQIALTPEEHQQGIESLRGPFGNDAIVDPAWVPTTRPVFEGLLIDDQRRLWVTVPKAGGSIGFEVFGLDGKLLAEVELPPEIETVRQPLVRGNYMYVVIRDEMDIPFVVRLRIAEASA